MIVGAELEALMNDALWNLFTPRLDENNSDVNAVCTLGVRFILQNLKFRCGTRWVPKDPKIETLLTAAQVSLSAPVGTTCIVRVALQTFAVR